MTARLISNRFGSGESISGESNRVRVCSVGATGSAGFAGLRGCDLETIRFEAAAAWVRGEDTSQGGVRARLLMAIRVIDMGKMNCISRCKDGHGGPSLPRTMGPLRRQPQG